MNGRKSAEEKRGISRKNLLLDGVVILLCVILSVQVVTFIREASDYLKLPEIDEGTLIEEVNVRQYERLVENVYRNEALGVPVEGDMAEIYATAYYYEAAMLYNAHKKAGNERQAEEKYAQMQAYEEQMGSYAFAKEEIWEFLGMDPEILK